MTPSLSLSRREQQTVKKKKTKKKTKEVDVYIPSYRLDYGYCTRVSGTVIRIVVSYSMLLPYVCMCSIYIRPQTITK